MGVYEFKVLDTGIGGQIQKAIYFGNPVYIFVIKKLNWLLDLSLKGLSHKNLSIYKDIFVLPDWYVSTV